MKKLPFGIELKRDTNYYFGLSLLAAAILCIVWAIWRDAFEPINFLVYFLIYSWGYVLVLKSDSDLRIGNLERAVTALEAKLTSLETDNSPENVEKTEEGIDTETPEDFQPGLHVEADNDGTKIFHEWKGEE